MNITDDVPANNTIWVLGDAILNEAAGHYNAFKKKKGDQNPSDVLYMESMYAIRLVPAGMYTAAQAKNMPNMILNSLVDTLNIKAKVPHTLIILVNDSRFWNNPDILAKHMDRIFSRFIKEIRRTVEARNLSLPPRVVNWDYPRIFITKPLPLPNNMTKPYPKGFKPNRRKYSRLLQRGENLHNYRTINMPEFSCENSNKLFAQDGSITAKGYKSLWTAISDAVHKADNQDRITLNKVKAKQLAAQITVSQDELKDLHRDDDDISDIEPLEHIQSEPEVKKAKRALVKDFDTCDCQDRNSAPTYTTDSPISEYFTSQRRPNHQQGFTNFPTHRFKGKQGYHKKSNWRYNKQ